MDKMRVFTRESLKEIEEHIKHCKEKTFIVMAEHDNEYTTPRYEYFCRMCGIELYVDINREKTIDYKKLICPRCSDEISIATLNIRKT